VNVTAAPSTYAPPQKVSHTMPSQKIVPGATRYVILTLLEPFSDAVAFDYVASNADRTGNGFLLRNNTLFRHRARGMLIKASSGAIVNNTIDGSTMGGVIVTPELYWQEADYAHNLLIEGNRIQNIAQSKQGYGGLALGAIDPTNGFSGAGGHTNITIIGNSFTNISFNNLWVSSVDHLLFQSNTFVNAYSTPPTATCCLPVPLNYVAWLTESTNVVLADNCAINTGGNATILLATSSVSGTGLENGITAC
jgi:hypothetical protein